MKLTADLILQSPQYTKASDTYNLETFDCLSNVAQIACHMTIQGYSPSIDQISNMTQNHTCIFYLPVIILPLKQRFGEFKGKNR